MDVYSKAATYLVCPDGAATLPKKLLLCNLLLGVTTKPQAGKPGKRCLTSNTCLLYHAQICQYLTIFNTRLTWIIAVKIGVCHHYYGAVIKFKQVAQ